MKKRNLLIPILAGLVVGQIFAEGERPFTLINTVRFGYDDNVYRNNSGETSTYVKDLIDFAFRAALSDRTDLMFKSRFEIRSDKDVKFYPNIHAVLSHSASPRWLLQLSDYYTSGEKTSADSALGRQRYNKNIVKFTPTYVLTEKDRLELYLSHMITKHDKAIEREDVERLEGGLSWQREIIPQRTRSSLNLRHRHVEYTKRNTKYDATDLTVGAGHTFNPEWSADVEAGGTHVAPDDDRVSSHLEPFFMLGMAYEPSPRTRLSADYTYSYVESDNASFLGQTTSAIRLAAQHDFTAKIMGKAFVRYLDNDYDANDNESGGGALDEKELIAGLRLSYKLNRINFLEAGYQYRDKAYSRGGNDWDQNMIDVGWRVEL